MTPTPFTTLPRWREGARRRLPAALAAAALMGFLVVGAGLPAEAAAPAPNATKAAFEISFMKEMIMHHHMAVMMAEVCAERTDVRPELRDLCEEIVTAQNTEIADMQAWLSGWYGVGYDPMDEMDPDEMMAEMEAMRAMPAAEFERFFLEQMIAHHTAALQPARQCSGKASHTQLKDLCRGIVSAQVGEIRLMRSWLCHWYDECNFRVDRNGAMAM